MRSDRRTQSVGEVGVVATQTDQSVACAHGDRARLPEAESSIQSGVGWFLQEPWVVQSGIDRMLGV